MSDEITPIEKARAAKAAKKKEELVTEAEPIKIDSSPLKAMEPKSKTEIKIVDATQDLRYKIRGITMLICGNCKRKYSHDEHTTINIKGVVHSKCPVCLVVNRIH